MRRIYIVLFITILTIGIVLRLHKLGNIPDSLNWDEVSWGYNAYSILKTGHDEHGAFMPLSFKAFGDFKQPVYVYLSSISIWLFGLSAYAVRFPSAFLGILTVPFVWLLVFELFKNYKKRYLISLLSMLFFSVSPWSIQFSRVAYEANVGLFFVVSGVALFLRGLNERKYLYNYIGLLLLSISGYSYHSEKIFTPILFFIIIVWSYFYFRLQKKIIILFITFYLLGNIFWLIDARTTARGRSVTFTSNQTQILKTSTDAIIYDKANGDNFGALLHNRRIVYFNKYLENYLSHFDLNYLFVTGDNARHHAFGVGVLYLVSLPFILLGMITIDKRKYWFLFVWLLLAPVASALAIDAPNASRSLIFLPTWQIFEAVGLVYLITKIKRLKSALLLSILILYLANFIYYSHNYFSHTNNEYGAYWQHGYKEVMISANKYNNMGKSVVLDSSFEQPYIFYLFYSKYDPSNYIASGGSERIKNKCFNIDSVYFGKCEDKISKGVIFISQNEQDTQKFRKISDIMDYNASRVGYVYESLL